MKKKLLIVIVALLVLATCSAGAYYLGTKNSKTVVVASSDPQNNQNETKSSKSLDLGAIMSAAKTKFPTVTETKVYTEKNDPNGTLGKPGYYVAGAAFFDSRTDYTVDESNPNSWGADAGGGIEVYSTSKDAATRADYLKGFQGSALTDPGAYKLVDKLILRASDKLTKSQQDEIIAFLESQI